VWSAIDTEQRKRRSTSPSAAAGERNGRTSTPRATSSLHISSGPSFGFRHRNATATLPFPAIDGVLTPNSDSHDAPSAPGLRFFGTALSGAGSSCIRRFLVCTREELLELLLRRTGRLA
jgi:hypothetical protein